MLLELKWYAFSQIKAFGWHICLLKNKTNKQQKRTQCTDVDAVCDFRHHFRSYLGDFCNVEQNNRKGIP